MKQRTIQDPTIDVQALIDEAANAHEPILLTGSHRNGVLLSEEDWRSIAETLHLYSVPGQVDSIKEADREPLDEGTDLKDLNW